jgi:hypothetical protein
MKTAIGLAALCLMSTAPLAGAYDYPLQFTPNPGSRHVIVAGYRFVGSEVVGNCSYSTASASSGRGGGSHGVIQSYQQTCTWDLYGNLLGVTPGAPTVPAPISVEGTRTVYGINGNGSYTGSDTKIPGQGFVSTPSPHYSWLTPNNNAILQPTLSTFVVTLKSDGDVPLDIVAVEASARKGTAVVESTTCIREIQAGATCAITVAYDPTHLTSPTGLAYETIRIALPSCTGKGHELIQNYTVVVPRKLDD